MIRPCDIVDFETVYAIVNDAAQSYKGAIPADCWKEPYMSKEETQHEIDMGVVFWGYEENGELVGVMGIQNVHDVTLIRHAYVCKAKQNQGVGSKLLTFLRMRITRPILIGTWADAAWATRFYEKHGFRLISQAERDILLRKYWCIPEHQIETSVVLADERWFSASGRY
jgi:N-acetylglutamate synthase-like GNAT family acetyltransferase